MRPKETEGKKINIKANYAPGSPVCIHSMVISSIFLTCIISVQSSYIILDLSS
jgi:hypothetical protein